MERLSEPAGRTLETDRAGWDSALLHQHARGRAARNRHRFADFLCGKFNFSESAESSRGCESFAAREDFDRDRLSVPRAAALSRQTQRARLCCGSSAHACECEKLVG